MADRPAPTASSEPAISDRLAAALESSCAGLAALEAARARLAALASDASAAAGQLQGAADLLREAIAALRAADERALSVRALGFVVEGGSVGRGQGD